MMRMTVTDDDPGNGDDAFSVDDGLCFKNSSIYLLVDMSNFYFVCSAA